MINSIHIFMIGYVLGLFVYAIELQDSSNADPTLACHLYQYLLQIVKQYHYILERYPVITKSVTTGFVGSLGDVLAQTVEHLAERDDSTVRAPRRRLDFHRTLTVGTEGVCVSGPLLHYGYEILDDYFSAMPTSGWADHWIMSAVQVILDILVMDTVFTMTFIVISGLLQGRYRSLWTEVRRDFWPVAKISWMASGCMSPLQFINFGFVPLEFRVLVTSCQDVIWSSSVSYMAHRGRRSQSAGTSRHEKED